MLTSKNFETECEFIDNTGTFKKMFAWRLQDIPIFADAFYRQRIEKNVRTLVSIEI